MTARPAYTAADAAAVARTLQRCPAASAYGDYIRVWPAGRDPYAREAERVRAILAACDPLPASRIPLGSILPSAEEIAEAGPLPMSMRLR